MSHESRLGEEWFASLEEFDRQIAEAVAAAGCRHCGGRLHQGNYKRKPRGGNIAEAGEAFRLRHSLSCGREGCRKRALPPSLRFLGRRVYLEAVVLLASALARAIETHGNSPSSEAARAPACRKEPASDHDSNSDAPVVPPAPVDTGGPAASRDLPQRRSWSNAMGGVLPFAPVIKVE